MYRRWFFRLIVSFTFLFFLIIFYSSWKLEEEASKTQDNVKIFEENKQVSKHISHAATRPHDKFSVLKTSDDILDSRLKLMSKETFFVIVLVHSAINHIGRRQAIRDTWLSEAMTKMEGSNKEGTLAHWFLIGAKVHTNQIPTNFTLNKKHLEIY